MANFETEIMVNEENDVVYDEIVADDGHGNGNGLAALIGASVALAVGAGVNLGIKGFGKLKAFVAKKKAEKAAAQAKNVDAETAEPAK